MSKPEKNVGIVICDRYHTCAGGKCLRALKNKEGAFSLYAVKEVKLVGYTTRRGYRNASNSTEILPDTQSPGNLEIA